MIDEKYFKTALRPTFGTRIAREFIARTNPQCMTSVKSDAQGTILHSGSFVIVTKGNAVFLECADTATIRIPRPT